MALNLACVGKTFGPYEYEYTDRDVILYALGVGATRDELPYLFEGDAGFRVVPSFAVIPANRALFDAIGELRADLTKLLHGEQSVKWLAPIPTSGVVRTTWCVTDVFDKGKGALAVVRAGTVDSDGKPLFENVFSLFIRGEGGFGGSRGPDAPKVEPPAGAPPDLRVEEATGPGQALVYRLSGDRNPLHASPEFATASGFERPILHGLCTFGYAIRALVRDGLGGDPARLKAVSARFTGVVYPGDRVTTEVWTVGPGRRVLRVTTDRGVTAISNFEAVVAD
jgi:acyl dehydratase